MDKREPETTGKELRYGSTRVKKLVALVVLGVVLATAHVVLGLSFPRLDLDIISLSYSKRPLSNDDIAVGLRRPVWEYAPLHGLVAGHLANLAGLPLLSAHIVASGLFFGAALILLMSLSFKITGKLGSSLSVGIFFSLCRSVLIVNSSGENDLAGAPFLVVLLYLAYGVGQFPRAATAQWRRLVVMGLLLAVLLVSHIQSILLAATFPVLVAFLKPQRAPWLDLVLRLVVVVLSTAVSLFTLLALITLDLEYRGGPLQFIQYAMRTVVALSARDFSFASSDTTLLTQFMWFVRALGTHLMGGWFHFGRQYLIWGLFSVSALTFTFVVLPLYHRKKLSRVGLLLASTFPLALAAYMIAYEPPSSAGEFVLWAFSLLFWVFPLLDYATTSNERSSKRYYQLLLALEVIWLGYTSGYEPLSGERWMPLIVLMAWHNALILDLQGFQSLNRRRYWLAGLAAGIGFALLTYKSSTSLSGASISGILSLVGLAVLVWMVVKPKLPGVSSLMTSVTPSPKRSR